MDGQVWKIVRLLLATLVGAIALCPTAGAQEYGGWTPEKFASAAASLQSLPPEERVQRQTELIARYSLDQVWALSMSRDTIAKPVVEVKQSDLPVLVGQGTLSVPLQFFVQASAVSLMVGHDAALAGGSGMTSPAPLLFQPFAQGRLLSLIPDAGNLFDGESDGELAVAQMAMMGTCNPQALECMKAQLISLGCTVIFVVGHEVGHLHNRDALRRGGAYPVEEELAADAQGLETLKHYLRNLQSSGQATSDIESTACLASPVAYFELNSRRSSAEQVKADYIRRRDALIDALGASKESVASLVEPDTELSGIGSMKVTWAAMPSLVLLDGVAVDRGQLQGLQLTVGRHRLVAVGNEGVGVAEVRVSHRRVVSVQLDLRAFGTVVPAALASLMKAKKWADILVATSDGSLRPRNASVAFAHWSALRGLGLAAWIDPRDLGEVSAAESRRARSWRASGGPLDSWDPDLADAVH